MESVKEIMKRQRLEEEERIQKSMRASREQLAKRVNDLLPQKIHIFQGEKGIFPTRAYPEDAGFDLTIVEKTKDYNSLTSLYNTDLRLDLPKGYYAEIFPRSSLSKSGYILANGVGVIDSTYKGNLYIALTKVVPDAPDLQLPFRCCQLVIKKQENVELVLCEGEPSTSDRGTGGFGSSGV